MTRSRIITCISVVVCLATVGVDGADDHPRLRTGGIRWGPQIYRPQDWATVHSEVINPTDDPARLKLTTEFNRFPGHRFGVEMWLPPRSRRRVVQPIRMPGIKSIERYEVAEMTTELVDEHGLTVRELSVELSSLAFKSQGRFILVVDKERKSPRDESMVSLIGVLARQIERPTATTDEAEDVQYRNSVRNLQVQQAPYFAAGWDGVSALALARRNPDLDSAQQEAIRQWLIAGGRVWILLDQMDERYCRELLGERFGCEVVGRTLLSDVTLPDGERVGFRRPVPFVRVLAPDYEVVHQMGDWPTALVRPFGRGQVWITTLHLRAWLDGRGEATEQIKEVATHLLREPRRTAAPTFGIGALEDKPLHTVADMRNTTLWVLMAMTGALLAGGFLAVRRRRPEWGAALGAALVALATLALLTIGFTTRRQVRPTVTGVRLAQIDEQGRYADITGVLSYYSTGSAGLPMRAGAGGVIWPTALKGHRRGREMTWTDMDRWEWKLPSIPPRAVQRSQLAQVVPLRSEVRATLRHAADGLYIHVTTGPFGAFEDLLLLGPAGEMTVSRSSSGQFVIPVDERIPWSPPQQKVSRMSDSRARRYTLQHNLAGRLQYRGPMLVAWTKPTEFGTMIGEDVDRRELMLVTLPVHFERPSAATRFVVPPPLIETHLQPRAPDGHQSVRFQLPPHLLPLRLESVRIRIDSRGETESINVAATDHRDTSVQLQHKREPSEWEDEITDIANAGLSGDGQIRLKLHVAGASNPTIANVDLFVIGRTLALEAP